MPSPFPGMNPYLEAAGVWQDFHSAFLPAMREAIAEQVAPDYFVSLEEHLYISEPPRPETRFIGRSDVAVKGGPALRTYDESATAVLEAPVSALQTELKDTFTESYLAIRDREYQSIVTIIELLSPANKSSGGGHEAYLGKRQEYFWSSINFIEIDLLRGWGRMPLDDMPACDYAVILKRNLTWPRVGIWPLRLKDPLPSIPIPLNEPDPDARLDLQAVLHQVYDRAKYRYRIYTSKPRPPLMPDDTIWSDQIVAEHLAETAHR